MKQKLFFILFTVLGCSIIFAQSKKEKIARNWLEKNKTELKIQYNHKLDMQFSRASLSGETFRFYQKMNGVQVFDAEVTIHVSNRNNVTYHSSTYDASIEAIKTTPNISEEQAFETAKTNINLVGGIAFENKKLFLYKQNKTTKLIYRITIEPRERPTGFWEVIVDAQTGVVISSKDIAQYYNHGKKKNKSKTVASRNNSSMMTASGTGFVFETDPLTATNNIYGGQYVDNNDATNTALDDARSLITLLDIQLTDGNYRLSGPYADIAELGLPDKGLFIQSSNNFSFNRQQDGFEAVNVYYHLDKFLRYLNVDLGLNVVPSGNNGVVRFDPHAANGADQSFYSSGTQSVQFGEGCVDDGEDADVIVHEVGHGVHDWITNGATSPFLGEGNSDYVAASYKRSFGKWASTDASYNFVFGWDGHSDDCWPGRNTADTRMYPGELVGLQGGAAHNDGQIWATTLMEIWDIIGREKTDMAFIEGIAMTGNNTNQQDAAIAVRQAAIDIGAAGGYTCADIQVFTDRFNARGYNMPSIECDIIGEEVDEVEDEVGPIFLFPNPTNGIITLKNIDKEYNIFIINMLGQIVNEQIIDTTSNTLDVSNLASGAYFIKFNSKDLLFRFIKE